MTTEHTDGAIENAESVPVADLNFSNRTKKRIALLNVNTVGELANLTAADLMSLKGFGTKCLHEVHEKLAARGFQLRKGDK